MEAAIVSEIYPTCNVTLESMVDTHGRSILRYCHLLLRDYHEAQDVVQTTFLKAYISRSRIKGELSPWLYKAAYNNCIDILRKRKKQTFMEDEQYEASYQMEEGMSEEIKAALGVLTPEDRALVISRVIDGMDFKQLSQIYGIRDATLRKRYERAKKKLADALRGLEDR